MTLQDETVQSTDLPVPRSEIDLSLSEDYIPNSASSRHTLDESLLQADILAAPTTAVSSIHSFDAPTDSSANQWVSGLPDIYPISNIFDKNEDLSRFLAARKHYFILSSAGKPIYSLHGADNIVTGYTAVMQAIVSFFGPENTGDHSKDSLLDGTLRSFQAGNSLFVFSIEGPIILVAVDSLGQSESQLRAQLETLYAQVLSTLTKSQIARAFQQHSNFDLRQLLGGTEVFLNALTKQMSYGSPSILLSALECLRLRKSVRERINRVLIDCRTANLLYGLVVADSRLVSVIRPRRHSLHPPDLSLLFSMLFNTSTFKGGGEHWAPICLPRFNSSGYLYAYINFIATDIALVLISPDKSAFFELREAGHSIVEALEQKNLTSTIQSALETGRFRTADIGAPLIRHFLYKSKSNVQFTMPSLDLHFPEPEDYSRLMVLYHQMHREITERSDTAKIYSTIRHGTTAFAWITPAFEMYCVTGPCTKDALSQSVRAAVRWIKRQEERLFIVGGATF